MGQIINPTDSGISSGIIVNEDFIYTKEQTIQRLQEIQDSSLKFVATKNQDICTMILTVLITNDFYDRFRIDYWKDITDHGTRFRDLIELSLMYKQLRGFLQISYGSERTEITFEMGQSLMQEIANKTEKLYMHKYEKVF